MQPDNSIRQKCHACAVYKPLDQFHQIRSNPDGLSIVCRECIKLANRGLTCISKDVNPEETRKHASRHYLYRRYRITAKQYEKLLRRQGGTCAICHKAEPEKYLAIDHDHRCCDKNSSCGKCVRGLLCSRCNGGIALLSDDSDRLQSAIGYLEGHDPMKAQKRALKKRRSRKLVEYMTVPEKDRFFRAIDAPRDRAIFRLLYHHGLRASEIGKLQMSDYREGPALHNDRLLIHRLKGSVSGECAMVPMAAQALRTWIRQRGHTQGPLFPSREKGPIKRCRIWQLMRKYCAIAGIPLEKAHPHTWKHTCCTHLISYQGESIMDVQTHVGHANISNTMIYAAMTGEANEERAKRLREWK